ncbi:MAG: hypothetical protein HYY90_02065 [Candidatus Omnitrophica bacterium]|nr:hypothetical protein [Candidatus Omnitrophota bacterium]
MRLFPITVSMAAGMFMMAVSAFAQTIEHPALLPFNVAGAQREVVTGHATTRARVALVASQIDKNVWRHPLYPFAVAGEPVGGTRVTKSAKTAAVKRSSSSEPAVWHPALVPFSIGGR